MLDRGQLIRALGDSHVSDWVLVERAVESVAIDEAVQTSRRERRTRWTVIVHDDVPSGRGSARVELDAVNEDAAVVVRQAILLARASVGPRWTSRPPSAPARVTVLDAMLERVELATAAIDLLARVRRPPNTRVTARVELSRELVTIATRQGFHASWPASYLRAFALVAAGARSLDITREARRVADLGFDAALGTAAADLQMLARAGAASPGPCTIVLGPEALLHGGGHGVWDIFASHADAVVARQGLTRYRLDTAIAPGADQLTEPLTITSDGTLELATRSAPVGDEGEAVRRFALVERGIAVGLGLTPREAALRRRDPNGGVRNLVVTPGTWADAIPTDRRVIEVRRLRSLVIDRYSGEATLELAVAVDHAGGTVRPFAGGTVRLDLVATLARARRSATLLRRGSYHGPASVMIDDALLVS